MNTDTATITTRPRAGLPLNTVYATLRRKWCNGERSNRDLAAFLTERLGRPVRWQACSTWATGRDPGHTNVPWDVVAVLLAELGYDLRTTSDGTCSLMPVQRAQRAAG